MIPKLDSVRLLLEDLGVLWRSAETNSAATALARLTFPARFGARAPARQRHPARGTVAFLAGALLLGCGASSPRRAHDIQTNGSDSRAGKQESTQPSNPNPQWNQQARVAFHEGRRLWQTRQRANLLAAATELEEAVRLEPSMAEAWSGLADCYALLGLYSILEPSQSMPKAKESAQRAIALDSGLAAAHASLGLTQYLYDWDWPAAEKSFRRAIEIDPSYATARHWYAMMLSATGRYAESVAQIERALTTDPHSRIIAIKAITILTAAGELERAGLQFRKCLELYPETALLHRELGFLRLVQQRPADALLAFELAAELSGDESKSTGGLGYVYGRLGKEEQARRVLEALQRRARDEFVPPIYLALTHTGLDETEEALDFLDQAYELHDPGLVYLLTKPGLSDLARDHRFHRLAAKIGLDPTRLASLP